MDKLLKLGHNISNKLINNFRNGNLELKPQALTLNGRVGWDSDFKCIELPTEVHLANTINLSLQGQLSSPACFDCPSCRASILSTNPKFQLIDLDRPIKCGSCQVPSKVRSWTCRCNMLWHNCPTHIKHCNNKYTSKQTSSSSVKGTKRIATMTYEELTAHDDLRTTREISARLLGEATRTSAAGSPHNILPPQSNILSPGLRKRFAYMLTE